METKAAFTALLAGMAALVLTGVCSGFEDGRGGTPPVAGSAAAFGSSIAISGSAAGLGNVPEVYRIDAAQTDLQADATPMTKNRVEGRRADSPVARSMPNEVDFASATLVADTTTAIPINASAAKPSDAAAAALSGAPPAAVDADISPAMSLVVDSDPLQFDSRSAQRWIISGQFPDSENSPLRTALAMAIVILLSAASAYGFVRLMCEKCPHCGALLQRHSAGCRSCGAHLDVGSHLLS